MQRKPRLTIEERILLSLIDFDSHRDDFEPPPAMTQEGLSLRIGALRPNVARSLKKLRLEGKVDERLSHVKGHRRRKKVYTVDPSALDEARELRRSVASLRIEVDGRKKSIKKATDEIGLSISEAFFRINNGRNLELDRSQPSRVEGVIGRMGDDGIPEISGSAASDSRNGKGRPFFGRADEIDALEDWMEDPASKVVFIHGMAGIGKTALVEQFCLKRSATRIVWYRFPPLNSMSGVLHSLEISLTSREPGWRSHLLEVTSTADIGGYSPTDIATALLSDLSSGSPKLLVLDDLHLACDPFMDVMRAMIDTRWDGVKIITTSRKRGLFYSRRDVNIQRTVLEIHLSGLADGPALEMLRSRGWDDERASKLVRVTGGIPIALELVGKGDGVENDTIGAILENPIGVDVEEFVREEVLSKLGEDELRAIMFFSVFRNGLPMGSAAIREAGIDPGIIDSLTGRGLITRPGGNIWVHTLIQSIVTDRMADIDWTRFHSLAADHYLKDRDYLESVMEALRHLSQSGRGSDLVGLLKETGAKALNEGFVELVMILNEFDPVSLIDEDRAWYYFMEGYGSSIIGDQSKAMNELGESLRIYREAGLKDKSLLLGIKTAMGDASRLRGEYGKSLKRFGEALSIYRSLTEPCDEDISWAISSLNGMGIAHRHDGDIKSARKQYEKALEISEGYDLTDMSTTICFNLGQLLLEEEMLSDASSAFERGLGLVEATGDIRMTIRLLDRMGEIAGLEGDWEGAVRLYEEALGHAVSSSDLFETAGHYLEIGERYRRSRMGRGLSDRLISFLQGKRGEEEGRISRIYDSICRIEGERGIADSSGFHERALGLFERLDMVREAAKAHNNIGVKLRGRGDIDEAREHYMEALRYCKKAGDGRAEGITHFNLGVLFMDTNRKADATMHLGEALRLFVGYGMDAEAKSAGELLGIVRKR